MDFETRCALSGIRIRRDDLELVNWRLMMLHPDRHDAFMTECLQVFFEELLRIDKNNYGRENLAWFYLRKFIKGYK